MDYNEWLRNHPNVRVRMLAEALDAMEDMGSPEDNEYVEVMSALKAEIELRMMRATVLYMTGG